MPAGHLVSVKEQSSDGARCSVGYLVAEQDRTRAVELVRCKVARPGDEVAYVCRVSEELLIAFDILQGGIRRADEHAFSNQQPMFPA